MKHLILLFVLLLPAIAAHADDSAEARKLLDKTAAAVNSAGGAQAHFVLTGERLGRTEGTIAVKGSMFKAETADAIVWYDGTTQWSYLTRTDEVNITTPTKDQQVQMNPLTFINLYKTGYRLSITKSSSSYEVRLLAESKSNAIQEVYVVIDKTSYVPTQVRLRRKTSWMVINISAFTAVALADSTFTFDPAACPTAEIIDLR